MRDYTLGALHVPPDHKVHNLKIDMDVYMNGDEELDVQEFAQFLRMVMNEWSNDCGFFKRPKAINGIPVIEDTIVCPSCGGKKQEDYKEGEWPCTVCGLAGEIYDEDKIFAHRKDHNEDNLGRLQD